MHPLPLHMPSSQCCLKPTVLSLPSSTHPLGKSPLSPLPPPSLILSHHAPSRAWHLEPTQACTLLSTPEPSISSLESQACLSTYPLLPHALLSQHHLEPAILSLLSSTHPLSKSPHSPLPPLSLILSHHTPSQAQHLEPARARTLSSLASSSPHPLEHAQAQIGRAS